ncbi:MAG: hypothetical protein ACQ9ET_03265, partial [Nitrosomonadaceae bacterium]
FCLFLLVFSDFNHLGVSAAVYLRNQCTSINDSFKTFRIPTNVGYEQVVSRTLKHLVKFLALELYQYHPA